MFLHPVIHCRNPNCQEPTRIPYPNPPERIEDQPKWPRDNWTTDFACRKCGRLYDYFAQDVRWGVFQTPGPGQPDSATAVFSIEARCGESNCGFHMRFHVTRDADTTIGDIAKELQSGHISVTCEREHPSAKMIFPIGGVLQVYSID